jgi:metallo-beta-lactamase family protein
VCESTYGNRTHDDMNETAEKLYEIVTRTAERGGKVLIPAFALGRTQLIIHYLLKGVKAGRVPRLPIFVDSPLAAEIADVYRDHPSSLSADLRDDPHMFEFLGGETVRYVREFEDSTRLATRPGPFVVIASSGMCDAGRIVTHLKANVDDPRCSLVLVSYQASGTTGRRMLEAKPTVRFAGREWNKWIDVVQLEGFSGHADRDDFLSYLSPLAGRVSKVRLIHGEREQAEALAGSLRGAGFADVSVPQPGDRVPLE